MGIIEYSSNNSGGKWWLNDKDWEALERAGWVVHWRHSNDHTNQNHSHSKVASAYSHHSHSYEDVLVPAFRSGERWLDALASSAAKETDDPEAAIREWEEITGQLASDEGCNCCGPPHSFSFTFTDKDGNRSYTSVEVVETKLNWY